jgi:hypothetical protein
MGGQGKGAKRIGRAAAVLAAGLALGLGSAFLALKAHERWATVRNGPWRAFLAAGSTTADPYTRAAVAIGGLLALDKSETLYFVAGEDEQGRALSAACDYRLEGNDLPARWWSVTLYGGDRFLIANPQQRFSYSGSTLAREPGGGYVLHVSAEAKPGNWLPSGKEARLFLALRLYNPAAAASEDPAHLALPRIVTEHCP